MNKLMFAGYIDVQMLGKVTPESVRDLINDGEILLSADLIDGKLVVILHEVIPTKENPVDNTAENL